MSTTQTARYWIIAHVQSVRKQRTNVGRKALGRRNADYQNASEQAQKTRPFDPGGVRFHRE